MYFDEILKDDDLLDALWDMHFDECTPIQELAIPYVLEGRDIIGIAQTGTGKTAAYLLPVLQRLMEGGYDKEAINCMIIAPTRELAQQIDQQMEGFAYYLPLRSVPIYGGTDGITYERQRQGLKQGADVIIATPGRLLAHISMGYVDLSKLSFLILDEADRMLDMGFYEDILQIVKHTNPNRQTLMFSATMPPKIKQLAKTLLNDPAEVKLAVSKPAEKIDQRAFVCYETQKLGLLKYLLATQEFERIILFASSKLKVKELAKAFRSSFKNSHVPVHVAEMHSDLDQSQRDETMLAFKSGRINLLIATDIVARGIDIDDISIVINYDVPHDPEDYVHRVGRTARAGAGGIAVTFVNEKDQSKFAQIESFIEREVPKHPVPAALGEAPAYSPRKGKGGGSRRKGGKGSKRKGGKTPEGSVRTKNGEMPQTKGRQNNGEGKRKKPNHNRNRNKDQNNKGSAPEKQG